MMGIGNKIKEALTRGPRAQPHVDQVARMAGRRRIRAGHWGRGHTRGGRVSAFALCDGRGRDLRPRRVRAGCVPGGVGARGLREGRWLTAGGPGVVRRRRSLSSSIVVAVCRGRLSLSWPSVVACRRRRLVMCCGGRRASWPCVVPHVVVVLRRPSRRRGRASSLASSWSGGTWK